MGLDAPSELTVAAWTAVGTTTYPVSGTYDVSSYANLLGWLGLEPPPAAASMAEVTFTWYYDAAAAEIAAVKGLPLTSLIPSTAQVELPNLGPYLKVKVQTLSGPGRYGMRLFGTNRGATMPLVPGDAILVDEHHTFAAADPPFTVYPAGYYAGPMSLTLDGPAGFLATLYGSDLTGVYWPLDHVKAGEGRTTMAPFGAWLVVLSRPAGVAGVCDLAATPASAGGAA